MKSTTTSGAAAIRASVSWSANGIAAENTPAAEASAARVVSSPWTCTSTRARSSSRRFGIPVSDGPRRDERRRGPGRGRGARRRGGREGAGADGWTREGRRRQARGRSGGGCAARGRHPRPRHPRARRPPALDREASEIAREYYLSVTLDRGAGRTLLMFTTEGGVEIEQVAAESPDALVRVHVDPLEGLEPHHVRELHRAARGRGRARADRADRRGALPLLRRVGRDALRGQPADRHARRHRSRARREGDDRRLGALRATPTSPSCATRGPPTRSRRSRASAASST